MEKHTPTEIKKITPLLWQSGKKSGRETEREICREIYFVRDICIFLCKY